MRHLSLQTRAAAVAGMMAAAMAAGACARDGTAPGGRLAVRAPSDNLTEGGTLALAVEAGGERIGADEVRWTSRNPSVLTVVGGVALGVAPGVTWVVAERGPDADSVRLTVRFADLGPGKLAVRLSRAAAGAATGAVETFRLHGFGIDNYNLKTERHYSRIHATSRDVSKTPAGENPFAADTALIIDFPSQPSVGMRVLSPPEVVTEPTFGIRSDSGVFLRIRESNLAFRFYVAVTPAVLEITSVTLPSAAGRVPGQISGRVSFQAAGLRISFADGKQVVTPVSDQTTQVYAEFTSPLYHILTSCVFVRVDGQPFADTLFVLGGDGAVRDGVLQVTAMGLMGPTTGIPTFFEMALRLPDPRLGTFPLGPDTTAASLSVGFSPFIEGSPSTGGGTLGDRIDARSAGGTFTMTEYVPPTDDAFGILAGTIVAPLAFDPARPGHAATLETRFLRIPITPLRGHPLRP